MENWRDFRKVHKVNEKIYKQYASRLSEDSQEVFWNLSEDQKIFVIEDWIKQGRPAQHLTEEKAAILNEELLDEGLRDWLKDKSTSAIKSIKSSLAKVGQEIKESGEAGKLILKAAKGTALSEEEKSFLKRQLRDIGVGAILLALFIPPGGAIAIGALVKLGKYYNIDILPSAFM